MRRRNTSRKDRIVGGALLITVFVTTVAIFLTILASPWAGLTVMAVTWLAFLASTLIAQSIDSD